MLMSIILISILYRRKRLDAKPQLGEGFVYANLGNKKNVAQCVSMETGF